VQAVAVGALEENEVGAFDPSRVAENLGADVAEIARERDPPRAALLAQLELDDGRAEDMAGVAERHCDACKDIGRAVVIEPLESAHRAVSVASRVQRGDGIESLAGTLAVLPLGIFLGNEGRIAQHDRAQIARGVIDMRVAEDHGIELGRIERKRFAIARFVLTRALHQSTVE